MLKTQTSKEHPFTLNNEEEVKFSLYLEEICQLPQFREFRFFLLPFLRPWILTNQLIIGMLVTVVPVKMDNCPKILFQCNKL